MTNAAGEFEAALKRLEEIVAKLEGENVGLDESVTLFKEGKVLALRCETLLKNAQSAIESAAKGEPAVPAGAPATLFSHDA
jgi:exodeoxyribonuclease VII small subunit